MAKNWTIGAGLAAFVAAIGFSTHTGNSAGAEPVKPEEKNAYCVFKTNEKNEFAGAVVLTMSPETNKPKTLYSFADPGFLNQFNGTAMRPAGVTILGSGQRVQKYESAGDFSVVNFIPKGLEARYCDVNGHRYPYQATISERKAPAPAIR